MGTVWVNLEERETQRNIDGQEEVGGDGSARILRRERKRKQQKSRSRIEASLAREVRE